MLPRTGARRLLQELSSSSPSAASLRTRALRPFTATAHPFLQNRPPINIPQSQQAAASAALQNLSHLTPAQITALLSSQPPRSRRSVILRRFAWAIFFFALGYKLTDDQIASFRFATPFLYPPVEYEPEEIPQYRSHATTQAFQEYPVLNAMVPAVSISDGKVSVRPTDWEHWEPYESLPADVKAHHLCAGALNNPNALGLVNVVFRHKLTGELILAIVFGQSTSGWPSVVHGGMLSTIMDEALGRLAALNFTAGTAVTAKLSMDFKEPVTPGVLYLVRVHKALPELQREHPGAEDKTDRKLWIVGRMEGPEGETAVEARGLFVVPKGVDVKPLGKHF
ncbi:thioesterase family protein [Colletotrichum truncatum]|uniref:Thioesterase family protein n=1 Tax=Colletotrichum truncatum TaxID=5467 RepID=A0ACC3Z0L6_COLTU|nr:thioesterase family protein [Colletotrichum truncatum]KAF6800604.1 thioesterase family protein [Colletotrichum truncatum]